MIETRSLRPILALVLLAPAPALAQKSEAEALAEIEFARGLAADWSFVDLAEEVLRGVRKGGISRAMEERLGIVECEVYAAGARAARDTERRNELFEQALAAYQSFISSNPTSAELPKAESGFVNTSATYAQYLTLALEEAVGEKANELRERQADVLTDAVKLTQGLIEGLKATPSEERSEAENRELYTLMLNRGQMLAEIGKAQEDGTFFLNEAIAVYEDLIFECGDGTPFALRAYVGIGRVFSYMNQWLDAAAFYEGVIAQTTPVDPVEWKAIYDSTNEQERGLRFLFLEIAAGPLMEAAMNAGEVEMAMKYGLHLYNLQRKDGYPFSATGYDSLLAVARAVLDSGGFLGGDLGSGEAQWVATQEELESFPRRYRTTGTDFALRVAQQVTDENKGNILQVRAQKLVSEVISRPGVEVSPDILVQAAEGEYNDGQYLEAIDAYRRVLTALQGADLAARVEHGAAVMNGIGESYRRLGRNLEAAMAYREAVTAWRDDSIAENVANKYYAMIKTFQADAGKDKDAIAALLTEAEDLVKEHGGKSEDRIRWNGGESARIKKNYDEALSEYAGITKESDYYERALVAIGRCHYRKGDTDQAFKIFDDYIENFVNARENQTQSPSKLANRKSSLATAKFFRGLISYNKEDHAKVVEYLARYADDYPEQDKLAPWTMEMLVDSHLALGDRAAARSVHEKMLQAFPASPRTGQVSITLYKQLRALRAEEKDSEAIAGLEREMAELMRTGNSTDSTPSFANLRNESRHWMNLGEWEEAERVLLTLEQTFANDADAQDDLNSFVRPDLGEALLALGKAGQAKSFLDGLVLGDDKKPTKAVTLMWTRAIAGTLKGSGSDVQAVAGAGGAPEEWEAGAEKLIAIKASYDKYSCLWYETTLQQAYYYLSWSEEDSRRLQTAKDVIENLEKVINSPQFALVDQTCSEEGTPETVRERLGGGVLQSRFNWMKNRLR